MGGVVYLYEQATAERKKTAESKISLGRGPVGLEPSAQQSESNQAERVPFFFNTGAVFFGVDITTPPRR